MKKIIMTVGLLLIGLSASAQALPGDVSEVSFTNEIVTEAIGSYYNWGRAQNGYGYCYEWASTGAVLNGGSPVGNYNCERTAPSYYNWGRAQNGYGYCYQYTPSGLVMNAGAAQGNYNCERTRPSYYSWGRGQDGYTRCYQYTADGIAMNQGSPVGEYLCK